MKIGVTAPGSSTNMLVNFLLAKAGLKPTTSSIVGVGAGAGAVAIDEARPDRRAFATSIPVHHQLRDGRATVEDHLDTRTVEGQTEVFGGAMPAGCLYAPHDFIDRRTRARCRRSPTRSSRRRAALSSTRRPSRRRQGRARRPTCWATRRSTSSVARRPTLDDFRQTARCSLAAAQSVYKDLSVRPGLQSVDESIKLAQDRSSTVGSSRRRPEAP